MLSVCSTFIGDAMFTPPEHTVRVVVLILAVIVLLFDVFIWRPL